MRQDIKWKEVLCSAAAATTTTTTTIATTRVNVIYLDKSIKTNFCSAL
jgi:hypothetical protein